MNKSINFKNNLDLPVIVESCKITNNFGKCVINGTTINSKDLQLVESCLGEWHLNIMFNDNLLHKKWEDYFKNNLSLTYFDFDIGKFSDIPYIDGKNYILYNDLFVISCENEFVELNYA